MVKNILIVGVGGQGTLLSSKIMGKVFSDVGYDVKVGEVHGMSQRGGSVVTYVRYGDKVYSPVICEGEADVIVSFEQLEAARWLPYLRKDGVLITNTQKIDPMPVISGVAEYPKNIVDSIKALGVKMICSDALRLAEKAGSVKSVNMVLLGVAARFLEIDEEKWISAICEVVPSKTIDINKKAFDLGYK